VNANKTILKPKIIFTFYKQENSRKLLCLAEKVLVWVKIWKSSKSEKKTFPG
jgi:hypothetical protein